MTNKNLTLKHGVFVVPGKVAPSNFLRELNEKSKRFDGTLDELVQLVEANLDNYTPGTGSVDGDVRLVHLPPHRFTTNITKLTAENAPYIKTVFKPRVEGEAPVPTHYLVTEETTPASVVRIVVYRADVLEKDNNRSSDAEWEMVGILADPAENVPMHPTTMARNANHDVGGTYREYTQQEWAEAVRFWNNHVKTISPAGFEKLLET